jgi:amidophosphoribosyltransferase
MFQTTVDSEVILFLLAQPNAGGHENHLVHTMHRLEGAYSLVIMTENELIGARDPHGFRPLCLGKVDDAWVLASETCALDHPRQASATSSRARSSLSTATA